MTLFEVSVLLSSVINFKIQQETEVIVDPDTHEKVNACFFSRLPTDVIFDFSAGGESE